MFYFTINVKNVENWWKQEENFEKNNNQSEKREKKSQKVEKNYWNWICFVIKCGRNKKREFLLWKRN